MEWRPAGRSVCLPLLIFLCTIKSRSSLLALAHPGGHSKRAVKWLWCGVVVHRTTKSNSGAPLTNTTEIYDCLLLQGNHINTANAMCHVAITAKHDVIQKTDLHKVLQCRRRTNEPQPQVTYRNFREAWTCCF